MPASFPRVRSAFLGLGLLVTSASAAGLSSLSASASSPAVPKVSGVFDSTPRLNFPDGKAPTALVVRTIRQGHGATVSRKSLIVVNYLGQIWRGKVFDSSYSKTLFGVPIGVGQVIAGWDDGLVGKRVGSRVLLVIPPKFGYGAAGKSQAGIKGTDTLTFVVDIVADYTKSIHGDLRAKRLTTSVGGVSVSPALAGVPKVTVAKRARLPKGPSVTLLARGHGPKIKAGLIVCQTLVTNWRGAVQASTWAIGSPDGETVGQRTQPSLLDKVIGNPVGSRFLALIPKTGASGPYAVVLIVAAQPHGTTLQHS